MAVNQGILRKYQSRLRSIPPPGGNGCHSALLGAANLGIMAGLHPDQIFNHLRICIPSGSRCVPDSEITAAVRRAAMDHDGFTASLPVGTTNHGFVSQKKKSLLTDGKATLKNMIAQSSIKDEADIFEASPIRIDWPPTEDPINLLSALYEPTDLILIGDPMTRGILGKSIRPAADLIEISKNGGRLGPQIIINPLNGKPADKKSGDGKTLRGDGNVEQFYYCLIEFDNLTREEQLRFWSVVDLPICALIDTGGKSIHGWIDLHKLAKINTQEQWDTIIKDQLYEQYLIDMGVDRQCKNASRMSRLPGHFRTETGKYQRLLWLSREGRKVIL